MLTGLEVREHVAWTIDYGSSCVFYQTFMHHFILWNQFTIEMHGFSCCLYDFSDHFVLQNCGFIKRDNFSA